MYLKSAFNLNTVDRIKASVKSVQVLALAKREAQKEGDILEYVTLMARDSSLNVKLLIELQLSIGPPAK